MKIAVLGYGVVGSGVVELLHKNEISIAKKAKEDIEIKYILDIRDFSDNPYANLFTKDFEQIVNDPEVGVVVEVIGGLNPAYSFVKRSLLSGKSVVTSNKELVATYGDELLKIAKQNNLNFLFEASVGGGIPIIRPINQCLAANEIVSISGILNGTTNYILTKMIKNGYSFEKALSLAQQRGYAERDPSADLDGIDTCRKIAILASLAFGKHVDPNKVQTEGIRNISLLDVEFAEKLGYKIKLLGKARKLADQSVYIIVSPFLVPLDSQFANVDNVFHAIRVEGDAIGETMFYGRGAGKLPTASAVVADVIDCVKHKARRKYLYWERADKDFIADFKAVETSFFVRVTFSDFDKLKSALKSTFGAVKLNVNDNMAAFITPPKSEYDFDKLIADFTKTCDMKVCSKMRVDLQDE